MKASKGILILISLIFGLAAITAFSEETTNTVFGPKAATTAEQEQKSETDKDTTASATKPPVDAIFLVKKISFEGVKTTSAVSYTHLTLPTILRV